MLMILQNIVLSKQIEESEKGKKSVYLGEFLRGWFIESFGSSEDLIREQGGRDGGAKSNAAMSRRKDGNNESREKPPLSSQTKNRSFFFFLLSSLNQREELPQGLIHYPKPFLF